MFFWRDEYFKILSESTELLSAYPEWDEYRCYCKYLEQGLRKKAYTHLTSFINALSSKPFSEKKRFVSWLCGYCFDNVAIGQLMPYPLLKKLIEPTLIEWSNIEPENSEPYRWLGTRDPLEKAIALNPNDEIACIKLTEMTLNGVDYSVHELPYGYLGDPEGDLATLDEIEVVISKITDEKRREIYIRRIRELRNEINDYLKAKTTT